MKRRLNPTVLSALMIIATASTAMAAAPVKILASQKQPAKSMHQTVLSTHPSHHTLAKQPSGNHPVNGRLATASHSKESLQTKRKKKQPSDTEKVRQTESSESGAKTTHETPLTQMHYERRSHK